MVDRRSYILYYAVREGNVEKVRNLLNSFSLSSLPEWSDGYVLLRDAVQYKHTNIAKLLLMHGSKVNSKNKNSSYTPLHLASKNGDIEIVQMLLDRSAYVNIRNKYGACPLHNAVKSNELEIVELLINSKADLNATNHKNETALLLAIEKGNEEIVMMLLRHGANVNAKGPCGKTALHSAAQRGYLQIVECLLEHGAYVNSTYASTSQKHYTPLQLAIVHKQENVVKLLLECEANIDALDKDNKTILYFAVEVKRPVSIDHILQRCPDVNNKSNRRAFNVAVQGCGERCSMIVKSLLQYGFTVQPEDANNSEFVHAVVQKGYLRILKELFKYSTYDNILRNSKSINDSMLLHVATKYMQGEVAQLLISYGADVNARDPIGNTPIFYAMEKADLKMMKLLLTNKANINKNHNLLHIAVKQNCREIVEVLLDHGAHINLRDEYGATALYYTVLNKYREYGKIARLLLSRGAKVNARTKKGLTILHATAINGNVKICKALLEYNVNVNSTCENNETSLHFAARKGNEVICKMLLDKGADVNAMQRNGTTALTIATESGHENVVEVLLKYGARIDSKIKTNRTLLHVAAERNYLEIVKLFMKFGVDIDSQNKNGFTALHIACKFGFINIVTALLDHGADITIMTKTCYTAIDFAMVRINSVHSYRSDDPDDSYTGSYCDYEQIVKILKAHMIKLKTANLYASNQDLLTIDKNLRCFQNKCEEEIVRMKSEKIDANVSFYSILTKGISQLAIYARNETVAQVLSSGDYKMKFPIYASMINIHFRNGERRNNLLGQGNKHFHSFFQFLGLPGVCTEKIFNYLSDDDLRNIMDACKPISNDNVISSL